MNALQIIWRDFKKWIYRKRLYAIDVNLRLIAERQNRPPEEVASRLFEQVVREQDSQAWAMRCWDQLSPRQQQIAAYICKGDTTRQISAQLSISPTTVKSHAEAILRKFGVHSRIELRALLAPWDLSSYL